MVFEDAFVDFGLGMGTAAALDSIVRFVLAAIVLYLLGVRLVLPLVERAMDRREMDRHARRPILKLSWFLVIFVTITVAFGFAGFGNILLSLTAILAAATLAIGFALQDVLKNFVAGVFIFTERPFRIGDWIEWDGHVGTVEDISLRVTRVKTFDNEVLTVPNSALTENVVKNPVAKDTLRLRFLFGIGYGSDVERATELIIAAAEDHPDILEDPGPSVRLTELADSSVGLQARIWIANPSRSDFVGIRAEFVRDVKRRFGEHDIEIPFPQRDLSGTVEIDGTIAEP